VKNPEPKRRNKTRSIRERLLRRISIHPLTGCWEWQAGRKNKEGYGDFSIDGASKSAHRVSYKEFKGDPVGFVVCHSCDNPPCINPDHLFLGSPKDNVADMMRKGRAVPPNWRKKLQAPFIMRRFETVI
jgi:hypothetical protein